MTTGIVVEAEALTKLERFFLDFPGFYGDKVVLWERQWAEEAARRIRARAPRDTGHYADNTIKVVGNTVFSDHPAARRLEFGFIGVDSLGRHYAQMPRPHWTPVQEQVSVEFSEEVSSMTIFEMRKHLKGL